MHVCMSTPFYYFAASLLFSRYLLGVIPTIRLKASLKDDFEENPAIRAIPMMELSIYLLPLGGGREGAPVRGDREWESRQGNSGEDDSSWYLCSWSSMPFW